MMVSVRPLLCFLAAVPLAAALALPAMAQDDRRRDFDRDRDRLERQDAGQDTGHDVRREDRGDVRRDDRRDDRRQDARPQPSPDVRHPEVRREFRDDRERERYERYERYRSNHVPPSPPVFHSRNHRFPDLPRNAFRLVIGPDIYFYWEGMFLRPHSGAYVVVGAPIGARVHNLPAGYVSFFIGPRRYFYVNATYYLWRPVEREYIVVEKPTGAERAMKRAEALPDELFIYPTQGQSDAERDFDRYDCHEWAVDETGYDPVFADPGSPGRADYLRAMGACLEGRGYTVR